jgi:hypothetical protein
LKHEHNQLTEINRLTNLKAYETLQALEKTKIEHDKCKQKWEAHRIKNQEQLKHEDNSKEEEARTTFLPAQKGMASIPDWVKVSLLYETA